MQVEEEETWRPFEGYEWHFEVSSLGNVRQIDRKRNTKLYLVKKRAYFKHRKLCEIIAHGFKSKASYIDIEHQIGYGKGCIKADVLIEVPVNDEVIKIILECKTERVDYFKEVKSGKWKRFFPHCHYYFFVCPRGVLEPQDIPQEAGLIEIYEPNYNPFRKHPTIVVRKMGENIGQNIDTLLLNQCETKNSLPA